MVEKEIERWKWTVFCLVAVLCLPGCHADDKRKSCHSVPEKKIDTAFLTVEKLDQISDSNLNLMAVTSECYTCHLQSVAVLGPSTNTCTVLVDTRWPMQVAITGSSKVAHNNCSVGKLSHHFREGGNYTIYITSTGVNGSQFTCRWVLLNSPPDTFIPIYVAIGGFIFLSILWYALKKVHSSSWMYRVRSRITGEPDGLLDTAAKKVPPVEQASQADPDQPVNMSKNLRRRWKPKSSKPDPTKAAKKVPPVEQASQADPDQPVNMSKNLRRRWKPKSSKPDPTKNQYTAQDLGLPTNTSDNESPRPTRERLKSLDTFRGISIVVMIFVNYRGGDYWFFRHSKWNGLTVADLVFPWFVWIMGTSMVYSFQSLLRRATPKSKIFWKIFKRSCILFVLGLLINSSDGLNPVRMRSFRIPGVLQRFAGTYLVIATIHMFFARPNDPHQYTWWSSVRDMVDYWVEWVLNLVLVVVWLVLTFVVHDPNCPSGYLGPGGMAHDHPGSNVSLCTGGAASYIDRMIFGEKRIYQTPTCKEIYDTTVAHDPEGLLGTLTSCFICFLGLQAGKILMLFPDWKSRVRRFLFWGVVLGILALILCRGWKNGGFIPINKNLWSLSFVLCMASFAFFLFAFCYVTIDVYKVWSGAPFYYPGMNAIVLYMGHEMINQPLRTFLGVHPGSHLVYLPINVGDTVVWVLLAYFLHHHKIFISV